MTRLDANGDVAATTCFYVDMSFVRQPEDRELAWFTVNYGDRPVTDRDVDLDAAADALREHRGLQRIVARVPLAVRTWADGDLPGDPEMS